MPTLSLVWFILDDWPGIFPVGFVLFFKISSFWC
jgi:hypothetical protein